MPRLPAPTIRLRLTALYGGLFLVSGTVLLAIAYVLFRRASGSNLVVLPAARARPNVQLQEMAERAYSSSIERNTDALHQGLFRSVIVLAIMTVLSIAFGYLVAGRVLRPLREMTATTRQISERNLSERLDLPGPRDELKDLADTIDGLLGRLEAHVAEQQRFAANASHELRTPLATTQALLDVARSDPDRGDSDGELIERLHAVNTRAIDLTEALLLLSRADQRSFHREPVDLSLIVEEAAETLLPLAEKHAVTIETSGDAATTIGSRPLLLQLATNLLHNAIVHNLPAGGTVWVTTTTAG
ncbi:MAG TPA: histidine kinase dimerization/phospho-acceptor domain-containing protein, partial [Solirubrobacterales bacterium]|nr:histidine kinase dimerization/phospho-acceptor domain-containing protein [Solirubrobacterales bacterium]